MVGVDHGGFAIKTRIINHLKSLDIETVDLGVFSEDSVDYPDIAQAVCTSLLADNLDLAILACGTGIGISIAANKIAGIRCAVVHDLFTAEMAHAHNNANAIAFGGRVDYSVSIESMIDRFLETTFQKGRHQRRVEKIARLEKK